MGQAAFCFVSLLFFFSFSVSFEIVNIIIIVSTVNIVSIVSIVSTVNIVSTVSI